MDLVTTPEAEELRAAVRAFLDKHAPAALRATVDDGAGYDLALWRRLGTELGVLGLAVPEALGGAGAGHVERAVVAEELGRSLLPCPFLSSAVLATDLLVALGDPTGLLPALVAGDRVAAVVRDPGVSGGTRPTPGVSGGTRLTLPAGTVVDGDVADDLLVVADGEVFHADATAPGVGTRALRTLDPTRRQARVELADVAAARLGPDPATGDLAAVALAAEQAGLMGAAVERTVAYVGERVQFGRPVGSYQAVKHGCADMYVATEQAVSAARAAAWTADHDPAALPLATAVARVFVGPAAFDVAAAMVRFHGGIGYTWEHDAHLFYKRAKADELLLGTPREARARLAELTEV